MDLSTYQSIYLYVFVCLSKHLCMYVPIYLSIYPSIHPNIHPSIHSSIHSFTHSFTLWSIHLSIHLYLSFTCLSIHPSIYASIYLSILFICLIFLFSVFICGVPRAACLAPTGQTRPRRIILPSLYLWQSSSRQSSLSRPPTLLVYSLHMFSHPRRCRSCGLIPCLHQRQNRRRSRRLSISLTQDIAVPLSHAPCTRAAVSCLQPPSSL